jgi:hypothetical protein
MNELMKANNAQIPLDIVNMITEYVSGDKTYWKIEFNKNLKKIKKLKTMVETRTIPFLTPRVRYSEDTSIVKMIIDMKWEQPIVYEIQNPIPGRYNYLSINSDVGCISIKKFGYYLKKIL